MVAMSECFNEMCPDCHAPTCLTIVEEDGTAVYICNNKDCKSNTMWEPSKSKLESLISMGVTA